MKRSDIICQFHDIKDGVVEFKNATPQAKAMYLLWQLLLKMSIKEISEKCKYTTNQQILRWLDGVFLIEDLPILDLCVRELEYWLGGKQ